MKRTILSVAAVFVLFASDLSGVAFPSQVCYRLYIGTLCRRPPSTSPPVSIVLERWFTPRGAMEA